MRRVFFRSLMVAAGLWGVALAVTAQENIPKRALPPEQTAAPKPAVVSTNGGMVKGVIRYQANPDRPWRLSRYYIKDAKSGWLAECVVALRGTNLAAQAPSPAPLTRLIDQRDFMFVPETLAIRAGDSVKFSNSDESLHNVMTNDGGTPFNINIAKDDEYTHAFPMAGGVAKPVRLNCVYHGGMRGWIYVFDHPFFTVTPANGRFEFNSVPAGEYTLEVVHPAGRLKAQRSVTIAANQEMTLEIVLEAIEE